MKIAIIGGAGKMGRWFADFLLKDGKEVVITGRNESRLLEASRQLGVGTASNTEAVKGADVVLVSVPVESFEGVIRQISPGIHAGQIVIDITSVKVFPVEIMHKHLKAATVLGAHPLFGPGARGVAGHNIVLTPTNAPEEALAQKVKGYLEGKGARVAVMTPGEHDEMMAVVLGLSHFIGLVSAETLLGSGRLKQMEAVGGTTFKLLLTLAESVVSEDPELYASLQMHLPVIEVEKMFRSKADEWADLVRNRDREGFVRRMKALKSGLEKAGTGLGKAYEKMYRIVEGQ